MVIPEKVNRAVLVVAHPGHELLLHGWIERVRPRVLILTDGSGSSGQERLDSSREYLELLGIKRGELFGRYSDGTFYEKILQQDFEFFKTLADEICDTLLADDVDCAVADSIEGYNSVHDICALLVSCAVTNAERMSGREILDFDYPVVAGLKSNLPQAREGEHRMVLDQAAFARKIAAGPKYYPQLVRDIRSSFASTQDRSYDEYREFAKTSAENPPASELALFRIESLRTIDRSVNYEQRVKQPPYYEKYGEQQVAGGVYNQVIRFAEHMVPIARALREHVVVQQDTAAVAK